MRCVHDPDTATTPHDGIGHVKAFEENFVPVENTVAVRIFVNGNDVRAAVMVGWSGRDFVVVSAIVFVATQHRQAGWIWILPILRDPQPTAFVETEVSWL